MHLQCLSAGSRSGVGCMRKMCGGKHRRATGKGICDPREQDYLS